MIEILFDNILSLIALFDFCYDNYSLAENLLFVPESVIVTYSLDSLLIFYIRSAYSCYFYNSYY